jgi:hypothetical protein
VPILTAGRPVPKPKEEKQEDGLITYEQLQRLIAAREEPRKAEAAGVSA